jgi:hypothetical protein
MNNDKNKEQLTEGNGAPTKHTPGPWNVQLFKIYNADNFIIADCGYNDDVFTKDGCRANAERIVECVNACDGAENPNQGELHYLRGEHKGMVLKIFELEGNLEQLQEERDELLAALKLIKTFVDNDFPPKVRLGQRTPEYIAALERMNLAILNAEKP